MYHLRSHKRKMGNNLYKKIEGSNPHPPNDRDIPPTKTKKIRLERF